MSNFPPLIVLASDFKIEDGAAGVLPLVIDKINPFAKIMDLTHYIPECNVEIGAMLLEVYYQYSRSGATFVAVVDPGVGTDRRIILARTADYFFIGPNNGLFTRVFEQTPPIEIISIENPDFWLPEVSDVFHGRDIMAPVAAHLSTGVDLQSFGSSIQQHSLVSLDPFSRRENGQLITRVLYIDGFGNMVLGVKDLEFESFTKGAFQLIIKDSLVCDRRAKTFEDIPESVTALLFGGDFGKYGTLAMNGPGAAKSVGAQEGDEVIIRKV